MQRFLQSLLVTLLPTLVSCSQQADNRSADPASPKSAPTSYVVLIVSGYDSDPTAAQIAGTEIRGAGNSGMFQLKGDLEKKGLECEFFNWNGTRAGNIGQKSPPGASEIESCIKRRIKKSPSTQFILIGHSWGGHTLFDVVRRFESTESSIFPFTILLDPSSAFRGSPPRQIPKCLESVVNYHTRNMFCWGDLDNNERVENVDLGDPGNHFMRNGIPNYSSSFDIDAHNSAEWDQKIHSHITDRILNFTVSNR